MLKIEHLKKSYENFSLDCSLEVKRGHVTGLIGQNGAGTVSYTHLDVYKRQLFLLIVRNTFHQTGKNR